MHSGGHSLFIIIIIIIIKEEVTDAVNEMKSGKGSIAGWISSGMFKERWSGSVRIVS